MYYKDFGDNIFTMNKLTRFFYPGVRLKRWIFLFILSFILFSIGVTGALGKGLIGINLPYFKIDRYFNPLRDFLLKSTKLVTIDIIVVILGGIGLYYVVKSFSRYLKALYPGSIDDIKAGNDEIRLSRGPKLVAIGGGTGLSNLLRGLKLYTNNITAVVTVADDGGSSGRLRKDMKIPPPGDIRNCMVALADSSDLMGKIFQHRFKGKGRELNGHSFGNLFIGALTTLSGSFEKAVKESGNILSIRGRVLPVTLEKVTLTARLKNGKFIKGQSAITKIGKPINRVNIVPEAPIPSPEALQAIKKANLVIMGPGSLYTSIIPNLLVKGICEEIRNTKAKVVYVCNIMTQPGETKTLSVSGHINAITKHAGENFINYVIINTGEIPEAVIKNYRKKGSEPVRIDYKAIHELGIKTVGDDLVLLSHGLVRHDPEKLAKAVMRLIV